jgi:hypothetical protein
MHITEASAEIVWELNPAGTTSHERPPKLMLFPLECYIQVVYLHDVPRAQMMTAGHPPRLVQVHLLGEIQLPDSVFGAATQGELTDRGLLWKCMVIPWLVL